MEKGEGEVVRAILTLEVVLDVTVCKSFDNTTTFYLFR